MANDPSQPGLLSRLVEPPKKVVLVRASRIGDFLCATPAFRALRSALPESEVTLIGLPYVRDAAIRCRHLNRFEEFPGFRGVAEQFFNARNVLCFLRRMQAERFDLAVQMHGSGVFSNAFTLLLGARATAGFIREEEDAGKLDAALPWPSDSHELRRLLMLMDFLGAPLQGEETEFSLLQEDHNEAEKLLDGLEPPLIGLNPAAMEALKRWMPERFAAVGTELQARYGGTVLVFGGPGERQLSESVVRHVGGTCVNLGERAPLGVLGAVLARLSVLVTNDSGPAHISYALGIPTVTIFGSTKPSEWRPLSNGPHRVLVYDVPCRPCFTPCKSDFACLRGVTIEQVVAAAEEIMRLPSTINSRSYL